jgi:hypothetical protein
MGYLRRASEPRIRLLARCRVPGSVAKCTLHEFHGFVPFPWIECPRQPNPERFLVSKVDTSVRELVDMVTRGELRVPEMQRSYARA